MYSLYLAPVFEPGSCRRVFWWRVQGDGHGPDAPWPDQTNINPRPLPRLPLPVALGALLPRLHILDLSSLQLGVVPNACEGSRGRTSSRSRTTCCAASRPGSPTCRSDVLNLSDSGLPGYALEGELALPPTLELLRCDAMRGFD